MKKEEAAAHDKKVNRVLKYGVKGVKCTTSASRIASGFVADKAEEVAKKSANYLTEKNRKSENCSGNKKGGKTISSSIRGVTHGGLTAFGTVYGGIEDNVKVLGKCLRKESVNVVQHKYGSEMGEVCDDAFTAAGNVAMTSLNVASLSMKGFAKKTAKILAKEAGKSLLED